jgi:Spy/CpxP family protein refolding chaperone
MKLRSIALALSLCVPLVSTSQAQKMPKARQERLMGLGKELHLTHKQAKQLFPILQAQEPQLQAIRNDQSLSGVEKLQRFHAVHDQSDPQVKAILTPQQFLQLQAIRQQRRAQLIQAAKSNPHQGEAARSLTPRTQQK